MSHAARRLCAALLAMTASLAGTAVNAASAARLPALGALPDWTGLWEMGRPGGPGGPPPGNAGAPPGAAPAGTAGATAAGPPGGGPPRQAWPYNAEWAPRMKAYEAQLDAVSGTEQIPDTTVARCIWGIPRIYQGPYQFDVLVRPEVTVFSYDVGEYRRIWTDGRAHPQGDALKASNMGDSIGHWEGETLVVDTIGLRPDIWVNSQGATLSDAAHVTERWSLGADGRLGVVATIEDPKRLTAGYTVRNSYGKVSDTKRMVQQACYENVREVYEGDKIITRFGTER